MKSETFFHSEEEVRSEPYRYRACGLDGIFLLNGYTYEEHDGERHVSIRDLEGLHKAIGRHLVQHRKVLLPREVRFLRNTMDLTQADLAILLGNTSQSVARWEKGMCEIPGAAEKLLRGIFLAFSGDQSDLEALRNLLTSNELDQMDETAPRAAQFSLDEEWTEKEAA